MTSLSVSSLDKLDVVYKWDMDSLNLYRQTYYTGNIVYSHYVHTARHTTYTTYTHYQGLQANSIHYPLFRTTSPSRFFRPEVIFLFSLLIASDKGLCSIKPPRMKLDLNEQGTSKTTNLHIDSYSNQVIHGNFCER